MTKKASKTDSNRTKIAVLIFAATSALLLLAITRAGSGPVSVDPTKEFYTKTDSDAFNNEYLEFWGDEVTGVVDGRTHISPHSNTNIPVYDTVWQMMGAGNTTQANNYFKALKDFGFTGAWSAVLHHGGASLNDFNSAAGGQLGRIESGNIRLNSGYINHLKAMLDVADNHDMKVGLIVAWQNTYIAGGASDPAVLRGSLNTGNACDYGTHLMQSLGNHPAISMWVLGGDAGGNNQGSEGVNAKNVWREVARCMNNAGNKIKFNHHLPTAAFDHFNYTDAGWLDMIAPETGHSNSASKTQSELTAVRNAYSIPTWQGEGRYHNITCCGGNNPNEADMEADAWAAKNSGVSGYVYGDSDRWTWCRAAGWGTSTPCNANNMRASFGDAENRVINVFSN